MDISGTTNVSSINASNAPFNNLSITTINNISVNNLLIDSIDPDGVNVNANGAVTIPHEISYFHPDSTDVENAESNGLNPLRFHTTFILKVSVVRIWWFMIPLQKKELSQFLM